MVDLTISKNSSDIDPLMDESKRHNAECDICKKWIYNTRFKCVECKNYDLCRECLENGLHPTQHDMVRWVTPMKVVSLDF